MNLAFFSGNEVFWKTRWTDDHRTLVTYKETHANEKIDPSPEWTGSWRDGRPANTERTTPENALTGTLFTVNAGDRAIEVPAADGRLRLWRGTSVAAQAAAGATAVLPERTLGYEWDEDVDNGSRPPGLVRFSTTAATGVDLLQDEGSTYAPGDATHHLTMYRDANGARPDALVFGAGTVQWSWGLDATHDRQETPVSPAMQQATANLLADMDAQPATPQDVQPAAKSTDRLVPSAVVDPEFAVVRPTPLALATITGSAADAGGGRVGAVEVSLDGGATWHPADGRERWSYTWMAKDAAEVHPQVRAADDSGNLFPAPPDDVPGAGTGTGGAGAAGAGGRRRVRVGPPPRAGVAARRRPPARDLPARQGVPAAAAAARARPAHRGRAGDHRRGRDAPREADAAPARTAPARAQGHAARHGRGAERGPGDAGPHADPADRAAEALSMRVRRKRSARTGHVRATACHGAGAVRRRRAAARALVRRPPRAR